ncbi:MAG: class I SAM-dependent methyltransferase [Candidatus Jettenia sp. CY-1]|nr:MAG: class I SAM-dependent methyltransferase [Candidatus Jettenia sp. CY-1]
MIKKLRREVLQRARGNVLELAVGTGKNLQYYSDVHRVTGVDLSPAMLKIARKRAKGLHLPVNFLLMDAENLAFCHQSFNTVVSSLSLCTFIDPVAALREIARVCQTDGHIILLEHGRSNWNWIGRWQDYTAERYAKKIGCHWNREPLNLIHQARLTLISVQRKFLGIFYTIEAKP